MRVVSEPEFSVSIRTMLGAIDPVGWVTGPGRSGAVAAVYASHILRVPFVPIGSQAPHELGRPLVIDTARLSGRTLRKAARRYGERDPVVVAVYEQPPRVRFWYEAV